MNTAPHSEGLLSGVNISNVSVTGANSFIGPTPEGGPVESSSIVDGVGWKWWCEAKCMPLVRDGYSNLWCTYTRIHGRDVPWSACEEAV